MSDQTDQIAAEAAKKVIIDVCCYDDLDLAVLLEDGTAIIKSAIEKAHDDGYRQGAIDGVLNERESRAAHASEQGAVIEAADRLLNEVTD